MRLTKLLVGAATILPTTIVPLVTITSCGQSWGNLTPFSIGSTLAENGPYAGFATDTYKDVDQQDMVSYLQSNYSIKPSSNQNYGYSTPYEWDEETKTWVEGNTGWYSSSDAAFTASKQYKDDDGKTQVSNNARNSALSNNISLVTSIGSGINNYINYALAYQAQQIRKLNPGQENTNLNIAWGCGDKASEPFSLDHGKKGGSQDEQTANKNFYEFSCAASNLNGGSKAKAMLRTSSVNFGFEKMPIPSYSFIDGQETRTLNADFVKLIENEEISMEGDTPKFYSAKTTTTQKEKEGETEAEYKYDVYTYKSVPVLINTDKISQTYVNPSKGTSSFLANDYYSDEDQIKKTIGNQWKDVLHNLTDYEKDQAIPHYKTFDLQTSNGRTIQPQGEKKDIRLDDTIKGNTFIGLISYQVSICYTEDANGTTYHHNKDVAIFNTMDNLFPSFFLTIGDSNNLYESVRKEDGQDVPYYMINQKTINNMNSEFLGLIRRTNNEGYKTDLTKLSEKSQNYLKFLGYMFGSESTSGSIITNESIIPTDLIHD